jgi:DNA mismatch repair protein MutS
VANDLELDPDSEQITILTGPNMAGKSTYLRQAAVIVLLAQCGSFVPAEHAIIGLTDRIFTRVGAHDDITAGMSTFMVEMTETAYILNHATRASLVILDEVGRGTSTYDGVSIAQSVVEHLHDSPKLGCRTLFATHYHELTALAERLPRVRNQRVEVLEEGDTVRFLHRVVLGGADRCTVHVAALPACRQASSHGHARLGAERSARSTTRQQLGLPMEMAPDLLRRSSRIEPDS